MQSIWKNGADNKEYCHSDNAHLGELVKFFFTCKEEIETSDSHINKPEQIRNDKKFYKWDITVQRRIYQRVTAGNCFFQPTKPWEIDESIQKYPCMAVFIYKWFQFLQYRFQIQSTPLIK